MNTPGTFSASSQTQTDDIMQGAQKVLISNNTGKFNVSVESQTAKPEETLPQFLQPQYMEEV